MPGHQHFDIADNQITPGCFVVYAALWDRSATLKYGIVTRLTEREETSYFGDENIKYTVRVITVDRFVSWDGGKKTQRWDIQKSGKEVTLSFLSRLLVIPPIQVPARARRILEKALQERTK